MTDYITQGSSAIWALLTAPNSFFANNVKSGNRLSFISGKPFPEKTNRQAGDYPEAKLRAASWQSQGFTGTNSQKTFGNTAPGVNLNFDFVIEKSVTYELTLTYSNVDEVLPGQLETAVESALLNGGINLGLAKVKTWGPLSGRYEQKYTDTAGKHLSLVQTIFIPVLFRLHRADVLGA